MSNRERSYDTGEGGRMMSDEGGRPSSGVYQAEHWFAWLLVLTAIVLGVIALLRGFGLIGDTNPSVTVAGAQVTNVSVPNPKADAFVWMLPAIAAGLLAFALHSNDYHRRANAEGTEGGLMMGEHWLSYLFALAAIVMGVLAILVGFNLFNRSNTQADGWLWATGAIAAGVVTNTLHSLRHHQVAADEYYVASIMEERMTTPRTATPPVREQGMTPDAGDMPQR